MTSRDAELRRRLSEAKCRVMPPEGLVLEDATWIAATGDWWIKVEGAGWYWLRSDGSEGWKPSRRWS